MSQKIIRGLAITLALALIVWLGYSLWPTPPSEAVVDPELTLDFGSPIARGLVDGNGTYVFYSRGHVLPLNTFNGQPLNGAKVYEVEFPLTTRDGATVYGMFYLYAQVTDSNRVADALMQDDEARWLLTSYIPEVIRGTMLTETNKYPLQSFGTKAASTEQAVQRSVKQTVTGVLTELNISINTLTILVYNR